jgi:hypothetical protein
MTPFEFAVLLIACFLCYWLGHFMGWRSSNIKISPWINSYNEMLGRLALKQQQLDKTQFQLDHWQHVANLAVSRLTPEERAGLQRELAGLIKQEVKHG